MMLRVCLNANVPPLSPVKSSTEPRALLMYGTTLTELKEIPIDSDNPTDPDTKAH